MPRYEFEHKKTNIRLTVDIPYDQLESFKQSHPDYNQVWALNIANTERLGRTKPPADFQKHVLGRVAAAVPGNQIRKNSRFGIPREI